MYKYEYLSFVGTFLPSINSYNLKQNWIFIKGILTGIKKQAKSIEE